MIAETYSQLQVIQYSDIREVFDLWIDSMHARNLAPKSIQNYRYLVGKFLDYLEARGVHQIDAIAPAHIRAWLNHRRSQGVSDYELHNAYRLPKVFLRWCKREGLIDENPFDRVQKPRVVQQVKPALTIDELNALVRACDGDDWTRRRDYALLMVLIDTGCRIGEVHRMTVGDAKGDSFVVYGKGRKRVVFLNPEARIALRRYLRSLPYDVRDESPLWWGTRGAPLSLHGMLEVIQRIGQRAGLKGHLGAHCFRRTYCIEALRSGCDLESLRRLVGHSTYAVLQSYLPLVNDDLRTAHAKHSPIQKLRLKRP